MTPPGRPPLFVVKGDASAEEVAALVAVLQVLSARGGAADGSVRRTRRSEWAAPYRAMRSTSVPAAGTGAWRASSLPR